MAKRKSTEKQIRSARRAATGAAMMMPSVGLLASPTAGTAQAAASTTAAMIPVAVVPEVSDAMVDRMREKDRRRRHMGRAKVPKAGVRKR